MQLAIGVILLLSSLKLAPMAWGAASRWYQQYGLARLRPRAVAKWAGQPITAAGVAVAGPGGVIESALARTNCVWHGHDVLRHYWSLPGKGEDERERVRDSIADHASGAAFGIAAPGSTPDGAAVLVDPEGAELSGAEMCLRRVVARPQRGVPAPADDLLARVKGRITGVFRGETIEFEYREWVVREGVPIVAHGVVELRDGRPVIVPPPDGRLRVESGDPSARPKPARRWAVTALVLAVVAIGAAGAGLTLTISAW